MNKELNRLQDMLDDYIYLRERDIDNSDCISPQYYKDAYALVNELRSEAITILEKLRTQLEVEE